MNVFTVVCGGLLAFFVLGTLALGLFSKRSALEILDFRPARPEAADEADEVAQMITAQNELRARRGKPARTQEDVERQLQRDQAALHALRERRWRES